MELLPLVIFFFVAFGIITSIFGITSFFSNTREKEFVDKPLGRMSLDSFYLLPLLIILSAFGLLFFAWIFTLNEVADNNHLLKSFIVFLITFVCGYVIFLLAKNLKGDTDR